MLKETVRTRAQDYLNDPVAARLLEQLHFRYEGALRKGQKSTPQSYADLMRDTKFSFKQVKRGLHVLREKGLIRAEQHLFGNKNVCHYTLPDAVMKWLEGQAGLAPEVQLDMAPEGQLVVAPEGQLYSTGTSSGTSSGTFLNELALVGASPEPGSVSEKEGHMKGLKSVMDVEQAVKAQKILHKPDSTKALEFIWKKRVAEITKAPVVFKKLDFHQLTQFAKKCPPGKAEEVLNVVLDDWIMFVKKSESLLGAKNTPLIPRVDFLLRNVQAAVILATPKEHPPMKHEAPIGVPSAKPVQVTSQPPEPKPEIVTSLKDIWADVEDDEDHK